LLQILVSRYDNTLNNSTTIRNIISVTAIPICSPDSINQDKEYYKIIMIITAAIIMSIAKKIQLKAHKPAISFLGYKHNPHCYLCTIADLISRISFQTHVKIHMFSTKSATNY
jgi:hypothetical protein